MIMSLSVKTAISIEENLLKKANELAKQMHTSRSKLFSIALLDFIKKNENQKLFETINKAYDSDMEKEDIEITMAMKKKLNKNMANDLW